MFIGEAPGREEDKMGKPFIGKTGQEVNEHYLPLAGLRRDQVYVTNAIKCLPSNSGGKIDLNRSKDVELLYACAESHLYHEIQSVRPSLLVPMGAFACAALDSSIELELQHGIPLETSWGTAFPMYHPAGGIHEPKKMLQIRTDWYRLGKYLKGKLTIPRDQYCEPYYRQVHGQEAEMTWFGGQNCRITPDMPLACDTEVTRFGEPYCITYSALPGTGNLIMAEDNEALLWFQIMIDSHRGPILFHNYPFDQRVVTDMGLRFPWHKIVDTMARSFHLGNLPQGLKALAYRELGMKMEDFDDLVTPHSIPLCLDYLKRAAEKKWPLPQEQLLRDEMGRWKLYKPQGFNTKLKRFFTDYRNNPNKDIFGAWDNWEEQHAMIEAELGPWPGKDIRYAPFDKVLHYACRDADATLRWYLKSEKMVRRVRKTVQEQWGE